MYAGKIIEMGRTDDIINAPSHPYTKGLIKSLPGALQPGETLYQIPGMMPNLTQIPQGCAFHPRCGESQPICKKLTPTLTASGNGTLAACHLLNDSHGRT